MGSYYLGIQIHWFGRHRRNLVRRRIRNLRQCCGIQHRQHSCQYLCYCLRRGQITRGVILPLAHSLISLSQASPDHPLEQAQTGWPPTTLHSPLKQSWIRHGLVTRVSFYIIILQRGHISLTSFAFVTSIVSVAFARVVSSVSWDNAVGILRASILEAGINIWRCHITMGYV